jgi:hypothetical protein
MGQRQAPATRSFFLFIQDVAEQAADQAAEKGKPPTTTCSHDLQKTKQ